MTNNNNFTVQDKAHFEKLLEMSEGYVLNFSHATLGNFIAEVLNVDLNSSEYQGSKATKLRSLWTKLPQKDLVKLLDALVNYGIEFSLFKEKQEQLKKCQDILVRLQSSVSEIDTTVLDNIGDDEAFERLVDDIKRNLEANNPEAALDRLHTCLVKYFRTILTEKANLPVDKNTPLHSLLGQYNRFLHDSAILETEMSKTIISCSIKLMESYNKVRNNHSLAHDNVLPNKEESRLIVEVLLSVIRFIKYVDSIIPNP